MLLAGLAFKIAAVPMHAYAGDVYQGAATPVTAFLAFVPKTSGFVAILKVLSVVGGSCEHAHILIGHARTSSSGANGAVSSTGTRPAFNRPRGVCRRTAPPR